jgi:hypothetical protein
MPISSGVKSGSLGMSSSLRQHRDKDATSKLARMNADERLIKNRERNKTHAKNTRERKKHHTMALRTRIQELEEEERRLREMVDYQYMANVLVDMAQPGSINEASSKKIMSSASICQDMDRLTQEHREHVLNAQKRLDENQNILLEQCAASTDHSYVHADGEPEVPAGGRRVKKYTVAQRETIRRERNRIHAKKTRDKKKILLESSENFIVALEAKVKQLRMSLFSQGQLSLEDIESYQDKDDLAQKRLSCLKEADGGARMRKSIEVNASSLLSLQNSEIKEELVEGAVAEVRSWSGENSSYQYGFISSTSSEDNMVSELEAGRASPCGDREEQDSKDTTINIKITPVVSVPSGRVDEEAYIQDITSIETKNRKRHREVESRTNSNGSSSETDGDDYKSSSERSSRSGIYESYEHGNRNEQESSSSGGTDDDSGGSNSINAVSTRAVTKNTAPSLQSLNVVISKIQREREERKLATSRQASAMIIAMKADKDYD